jgi:hypothetical protein
METGHHVSHMGHKGKSDCHRFGYRPTPGLMSLFSKTGERRLNPKPPISHMSRRCSYTDVIRGSMEQGGASSNSNHLVYGQHGFQAGTPWDAGQADAFRGGFNMPYQGYGAYGRRGVPNRFQNRGRGFGAQQMLPRGGFESYHRPQVGTTVPQHPPINMAGPVETLPFWHQIRMPIILAMRAPCDFQSQRHRWFRR